MSRRRIIAIVAALAVLFVPVIPITIVPEWRVQVVDEQGQPQPGTQVREIWHHYTFAGEGGEEDLATDDSGIVVFHQRRLFTSLGVWVLAIGVSKFAWIFHGGSGPMAFLMCLNASCSEYPTYVGDPSQLENTRFTALSEATVKKRAKEMFERLDKQDYVPSASGF